MTTTEIVLRQDRRRLSYLRLCLLSALMIQKFTKESISHEFFVGDSTCAGSNLFDDDPVDAWPVFFVRMHPEHVMYNLSQGGRPTSSIP